MALDKFWVLVFSTCIEFRPLAKSTPIVKIESVSVLLVEMNNSKYRHMHAYAEIFPPQNHTGKSSF